MVANIEHKKPKPAAGEYRPPSPEKIALLNTLQSIRTDASRAIQGEVTDAKLHNGSGSAAVEEMAEVSISASKRNEAMIESLVGLINRSTNDAKRTVEAYVGKMAKQAEQGEWDEAASDRAREARNDVKIQKDVQQTAKRIETVLTKNLKLSNAAERRAAKANIKAAKQVVTAQHRKEIGAELGKQLAQVQKKELAMTPQKKKKQYGIGR